jgi:hypothetical protein
MPVKAPPSSDNLYLGKGQVLFNRFDVNNALTYWRHLGNVDKFDLSTADTKVQKFSAMQASAPLYKEVITKRIVTLALTLSEFHPENLALFTQGSTSTLVQAATPVVAEPISATTVPGSFYVTKLLGPITAVSVKFGAGAGVAGVDFTVVDAKAGLIQILPGTILTGAVTVDYTPTAYTGTTGPSVISGGSVGRIEGALKFLGDPTSGPRQNVDVWHVLISPNGALGLISDGFADIGLNMEVLDDSTNHPASPLYQMINLP